MSTVTGYNTTLNISGIDKCIADLAVRSLLCPDVNGDEINISVLSGMDIILSDALNGEQPAAEDMPCIRIFAQTENHPVESMSEQTDVLGTSVHMMYYFLYSFMPNMEFNFEQYRRAHIRTNRQWLEEWNGFAPNMGTDGWQFDNPQTITVIHNNALRDLIGNEQQINFAEGFYASRMDFNVLINEVKQF